MKNSGFAVTGALLLSFIFVRCSKDPLENLNEDESRIYITNHDNTADFKSFTTFSIADSVAIIENNVLVKKQLASFDVTMINAMKTMMTQRGYAEVGKNADPDLVINLSRIYNDVTGIIDYSVYYDSYFGYYDPFYWGYPGYNYFFPPAFYGSYTIQVGGVNIDMFDAMNANDDHQLKLVWNGLIRGEGTFTESKAEGNVMALFEQSKYIEHD